MILIKVELPARQGSKLAGDSLCMDVSETALHTTSFSIRKSNDMHYKWSMH